MKRLFCLLLAVLMMTAVLASCSPADDGNDEKEEDRGAIIPVYLSADISNFDPATANLDDASTKIFGLIYEGLYKYDENGKVVNAQASSLKVLDNPDKNYYAIEINLKTTYWSDGTQVQASDYIFAWKRIIQPGFRGEAASLLFDIKNARACNSGELSIDDLGVTDSTITTLHIEFEGPTDYDKFCEYLASPYLVPLRENVIYKVEKDWSTNPTILVTNGPFCVRTATWDSGKLSKMIIERNMYYMRNVKKDKLDKYVTPFRFYIDCSGDAAAAEAQFAAGNLAYISEFPLSKRAEYASKAEVVDTLSVMSVLFNTTKAPLDKAETRLTLSKALDRTKIADILTFAKPAGGIIADKVFENGYSKNAKSFREVGGNLVDAKAASGLPKVSGSITLAVRDTEADKAVGEYIAETWGALGLKVTVKEYGFKKYQDVNEYDLIQDKYIELYESGEFDAILIDYTMFCTDAFANLASFAKDFAGGFIDMTVPSDDYSNAPHVCGYDSEEYNAKIEEAYAEKDPAKRAAILHEAEKILMTDMPIVPLVQLQNAFIADTSNFKNKDKKRLNYYGFEALSKAEVSDREKYTFGEEEQK